MDLRQPDPARKSAITFPNGNRSIVVNAPVGVDAAELVQTLGIKKPKAVVLLIGGADELDANLNSQLKQLLEDGVALAATDTEALIIDGGTNAGVMALMGKVVAERGRVTQLLGIAPAGKVTYTGGPPEGSIPEGAALDPNHSHFILVDGTEWSSGTEMMFKVTDGLAAEARVVAVLVNGGVEAKEEVVHCEERGWPIIVIEGSGRLADEIAKNARLTSAGDVLVFPLSGTPVQLRQLIVGKAEDILLEAWRRFARYDSKAASQQRIHSRFIVATLVLGVASTVFALLEQQLPGVSGPPYDRIIAVTTISVPVIVIIVMFLRHFATGLRHLRANGQFWVGNRILKKYLIPLLIFLALFGLRWTLGEHNFITNLFGALHYLVLATPIVISVLLAASDRFKPGKKWILLRGSAEVVKAEIFRYRTQVGEYEAEKTAGTSPPSDRISPETALAEKLATLSQRLMKTEVGALSLPYKGPLPPPYATLKGDDGTSFLTPDRYLEVRLVDQLNYYSSKSVKLDRRMSLFQWSILILGGLGTLVAAIGHQLWIAAAITAFVTALTAYVGHFQIERVLTKYNQSAAELSNVRLWWSAMHPEARRANKHELVERTEKIFESERTDWVQQMEDALAKPRAASAKDKEK